MVGSFSKTLIALIISGGGTFDGEGHTAWGQNNCARTGTCNLLLVNLCFTKVTNSIIQHNFPEQQAVSHGHFELLEHDSSVSHHQCNRGSLNTDGIHMGCSTGVNISDAIIKTGDDSVSIGDGSQHINVEKVTCGPGHGISVGSLGKYHNEEPVGVTVKNCTLINTMNGIRVKTWPDSPTSVATDLHFEDIIMNNVGNPILINQEYCPYDQCQAKVPWQVKISDVSFQGICGMSGTQVAVKLVCSRGVPCQTVDISDINLTYKGKEGPEICECANVKAILSWKILPPAFAKPA